MFSTGQWLLLIWLGMLGACVGSFLNVVIYRLPRGESLVRPGSRCPSCGSAIRPYHNIPVLGWLMLRGRCHDCGVSISWRYPAVEALTGALFCLLAVVVFRVADAERPAMSDLRCWGIYAGLMVTVCSLMCVVWIRYDRQPVPRGLYAALAVGLVVAGVFLWWAFV